MQVEMIQAHRFSIGGKEGVCVCVDYLAIRSGDSESSDEWLLDTKAALIESIWVVFVFLLLITLFYLLAYQLIDLSLKEKGAYPHTWRTTGVMSNESVGNGIFYFVALQQLYGGTR
jgi:hypothetical protein